MNCGKMNYKIRLFYIYNKKYKGGDCMTTVNTKSGKIINVVSREEESKTLTLSDREMDARAVEAVKAAINKARVCKKPIAGYDKENKKAYIEYANGDIKYAK